MGRGVAPAALAEAALLPLRLVVGQLPLPGDGLRTGLVTVWPREGRAPSVSEAAERALVSNATAYPYFASADERDDAKTASSSTRHLADAEVGQAVAVRHFEQPLRSGYLLDGAV